MTTRRGFLKSAGLVVGCMLPAYALSRPPTPVPDDKLAPEQLKHRKLFEAICGDPQEQLKIAATETVKRLKMDDGGARGTDAMVPEIWARESLALLEENMVVAGLVHRDFEQQLAQYGDCVNARAPAAVVQRRKTDDDESYECEAWRTPVALDEHIYSRFEIPDGYMNKPLGDLVDMHLAPAMAAMAKCLDMILVEKIINAREHVCLVSGHTPKDLVIGAREKLNRNCAFTNGRHTVIPTEWEAELLKDGTLQGDLALGFQTHQDPSLKQGVSFHENALSLTCRPTPLPGDFMGVKAHNATHNNLSMRCVIQYNIDKQATVVNLDMLTGFAIHDLSMLCIMNRSNPILSEMQPGMVILDRNLRAVMLG